jgi:hypothetical protein
VTVLRGGSYSTVAASSELIRAVDEIQHGEQAGPCVEALQRARPVADPDLAATVRWPHFAREAARLGLRGVVSVPVFVARGEVAAVLNLLSRDQAAMLPLVAAVWAIYDPDHELPPTRRPTRPLAAGDRELLAGFAAAMQVRATIQRALRVLMAQHGEPAEPAYRRLIAMSAEAGLPVPAVARSLLDRPG